MRTDYIIVPGMLSPSLVNYVRECLVLSIDQIDERGQFPREVRLDLRMEFIASMLAHHPTVQHLLDARNLRCHWPPMARCMQPKNLGAMWAPHRDTEYNPHIDGDFLTVWLPLTPIVGASDGGLMVLEPIRYLAPLAPGDAVIMSKDCLHASMSNYSDTPRLSLDFRFFSALTPTTKHYFDTLTDRIVAPC